MPAPPPTTGPSQPRRNNARLLVLGLGAMLGCATLVIGVPLFLRMFVVEAFKTPSGSMIPTLVGGDHIFTDKHVFSTREPRRGEVIVHAFPENPRQDFVKRVIGVAGDRLEVKGGHPWINGWEVPHCDVGAATYAEADDLAASSAAAVHRGEVFVLGDNRNNSHDSRFWWGGKGGGVPLSMVRARPFVRWLSDDGNRARLWTPITTPVLPASMTGLEAGLKRCLDAHPPHRKTAPP